jgi:hypothetical protein
MLQVSLFNQSSRVFFAFTWGISLKQRRLHQSLHGSCPRSSQGSRFLTVFFGKTFGPTQTISSQTMNRIQVLRAQSRQHPSSY